MKKVFNLGFIAISVLSLTACINIEGTSGKNHHDKNDPFCDNFPFCENNDSATPSNNSNSNPSNFLDPKTKIDLNSLSGIAVYSDNVYEESAAGTVQNGKLKMIADFNKNKISGNLSLKEKSASGAKSNLEAKFLETDIYQDHQGGISFNGNMSGRVDKSSAAGKKVTGNVGGDYQGYFSRNADRVNVEFNVKTNGFDKNVQWWANKE